MVPRPSLLAFRMVGERAVSLPQPFLPGHLGDSLTQEGTWSSHRLTHSIPRW